MNVKIKYNSPVVLTFALFSLIVLLVDKLSDGQSTKLCFCVYKSALDDPLTYVRMFGHVLGHANLEHYVNNMLYILLLGPILEEKYGSGKMLGMIMLTALVTGLINTFFFDTALLGASGVVFMMIMLTSMVSFKQGEIPITMICVCVLYLGNEVITGVFTQDNISQLTHVVGGICGGIFGWMMNKGK
ncbi:MAG: rhomboid family intramembrane serine protease [Lachnospiraceae bacterium]|nr:rhomboid family intramembrane serine protease [Lachnospiraceae bacterium]